MRQQDCFELGLVARLHGFQGQVQISIDADDPSRYAGLDALFLEVRGQLVPFIIEKLEMAKDRDIVKFQGVDTQEDAEKLRSLKVFLPLALLPQLEGNKFYFHEVVGFKIQDQEQGTLGTITTVYNMPTQDLLAMDYKGVEVLIPIADDIVLTVDRENKVVHTHLPKGLVEVYTEQE